MNSRDYWREREKKNREANIKKDAEYDKELSRIYQNALDEIQKEIEAFYGKYAEKEGISIAEAKKRAEKLDIEAYGRKAAKYVKEKDFSDRANAEMRLYNMTMKVNRLELLKSNIGLELTAMADEWDRKCGEFLTERATDEFERQAGILGHTVEDNSKKARTIVNASFKNATFSDRIWSQQEELKGQIDILLQRGMIQGKNPKVLARDIQKQFGSSKYEAERLMRTEMTRVQTEAQKTSYEENGFDEYEYMGGQAGQCDICAALDGKHFKVKNMVVGENAPPMHPNCRCSVAAYMDSEEYEEWLDGYKDHGLGFDEWKKVKPYADNLLEKAKKEEPRVTSTLKEAVSNAGAHLEGLDYRIKGKSSLIRKLATKSKAKGLTVVQYSSVVTDVLRYTSVSETKDFTKSYSQIIAALSRKGYNIIEVANTLKDKMTPYRGINTLVQSKRGYVFELQFHTPESLEVKEKNHKLYEEQRLASTSKLRKLELDKTMRKNAQMIPTPAGIEKIGDIKNKNDKV